jgi:uncharacterized membrane protein
VTAGHVLHAAEEHVYDVDLTVEEGIQAIVTSGVATGRRSDEALSDGMLDRFERRLDAADVMVGIEELEETARETVAAARSKTHLDDEASDGTNRDRDRDRDAD